MALIWLNEMMIAQAWEAVELLAAAAVPQAAATRRELRRQAGDLLAPFFAAHVSKRQALGHGRILDALTEYA